MDKEVIADLINLLNSRRLDLKRASCSTVFQLTGAKEGLELILHEEKLILAIMSLIENSDDEVARTSLKMFINLSADEDGAELLCSLTEGNFIEILINCIQNKTFKNADHACGILANITRLKRHCPEILRRVHSHPLQLHGLIDILCTIKYNQEGASLDLLASVICNFTQSYEGRREILNKETNNLERLLPFVNVTGSSVRKKAIISAIHNCCFEKDYHDWLLSNSIDISNRLALPLAGPDVFTVEENESLPADLQFLADDKCREEDPELRALLLESFLQLCATRKHRKFLRDQNIYLILREHHKWETDKKCILLNEDVVNLLIQTEEEIGEEDLSTVDVPSHLTEKFKNFDSEILAEVETK